MSAGAALQGAAILPRSRHRVGRGRPVPEVARRSPQQGTDTAAAVASALDFLKTDAKVIDPKEVPLDQLRKVVAFNKDEITRLVEKHWGKVAPATAGEKLARIRNLSGVVIRRGKGDPVAGKPLFTQHCATCHTLFGEGQGRSRADRADRKNLDFLLSNVVDPSGLSGPSTSPTT
jgi:hypothetical protein